MMLFAFSVVATVFCVRLLCILYDLCNCLHCCVKDTLSYTVIRLCKMSLSYEESDIFFEQRVEVSGSGSRVCEILGDLR